MRLKMTDRPYMPLWVNDFLGDTLGLTSTQCGQYMFLLMAMWNAGGELPDDPELLRRIARGKISSRVMDFFDVNEGIITQKRLAEEAELARKKIIQASLAGKASARVRALKRLDVTATDVSIPLQRKSNHLHLQLNSISKDTNTKRARGALNGFEKFWDIYPNKVSKGAAIKSWPGGIKKATAEEIIAGVERYKSNKPADRAWCNPSTFLNGERWLDKPEEVVKEFKPENVKYRPTGVFNGYQTLSPAEPWVPPTPEEIARRDAAIKAMRSAVKRV